MKSFDRVFESCPGKTFFVYGAEPFQGAEFCDVLKLKAKDQGIAERLVFEVSTKECWHKISVELDSLSLFSSKRLIEIYPEVRALKDGKEVLSKILNRSNSDVLLIKVGHLDFKAKKSTWFSMLSNKCVTLCFEQPTLNEMPEWIAERFASYDKKVSREAAALIAERTEGNLMSTAHEIEKLILLIDSDSITLSKVVDSVLDGTQFSIYDYRDSFLQGDLVRSVKIIKYLENAGVEPLVVNWIIRKELRDLTQISVREAEGESFAVIFKSLRIWGDRMGLLKKALRRGSVSSWFELLIESANIGLTIKGAFDGDPWEKLGLLTVRVCSLRSEQS